MLQVVEILRTKLRQDDILALKLTNWDRVNIIVPGFIISGVNQPPEQVGNFIGTSM